MQNNITIDDLLSVTEEVPPLAPVSLLSSPVPAFNFQAPPVDPARLCRILYQAYLAHPCLGLAANQLGLPYRVIICGDGNPTSGAFQIFFNPKIVSASGEPVLLNEGCISFPGMILGVRRPPVIRMRFQDQTGYLDTSTFSGITARVLQHEVDHLDGIIFTSKVSRLRRDRALRKARKHE